MSENVKVYGLWDSSSAGWWRDSTGRIMASPWQEVVAAQLKTLREDLVIEIIAGDGLPEHKRPSAIPSRVSHAPLEEESGD